MSRSHSLRRGVLAAAVLAALGYGGAQALATPQAATDAGTCTAFGCNTQCILDHYDYGICVEGICECWYRTTGG